MENNELVIYPAKILFILNILYFEGVISFPSLVLFLPVNVSSSINQLLSLSVNEFIFTPPTTDLCVFLATKLCLILNWR